MQARKTNLLVTSGSHLLAPLSFLPSPYLTPSLSILICLQHLCRGLESNPNHGDELREYMELLRDGQTDEDMSDMQDYFQMFYGDEVRESTAGADSGKVKRALRRDLYTTAKRNNLSEFSKVLNNFLLYIYIVCFVFIFSSPTYPFFPHRNLGSHQKNLETISWTTMLHIHQWTTTRTQKP